MEFDFTPEQIQLRKSVREFAEQEIRAHVLQWDEEEIFPLEVIKKAGQLGFLGAIFPEELGGSGLGYIEYSIIIEELSRIDPSVGLIVAAHNSLCTNHIFVAGSQYIESDAVFAVKKSLIKEFTPVDDPEQAAEYGLVGSFCIANFDIVLHPAAES